MAKFFKAKKGNSSLKVLKNLTIDSLDSAGKGVILSTRPITLVTGGLPQEHCDIRVVKASKSAMFAEVLHIHQRSAQRVEAFCPHYQRCGACSVQHLTQDVALEMKSASLAKRLEHQCQIDAETWETPIRSPREYRRKVRLAIDARHTQKPKIGLRAKASNEVLDIEVCPILVPALQAAMKKLSPLLKAFSELAKVGHVQLLETTTGVAVYLHLIKALSSNAHNWISKEAAHLDLTLYTSPSLPSAPSSMVKLAHHKAHAIEVGIEDFVQSNQSVNQQMLTRALDWLAVRPDQVLFDFFAGAGNFSLVFAPHVRQVKAYEAGQAMVERCMHNAKARDISKLEASACDLSDPKVLDQINVSSSDCVILDPARAGAQALCEKLVKSEPQSILYVSCNPNTFIRDLAILQKGYKLTRICTLDMFPFTEHLELMALFERTK